MPITFYVGEQPVQPFVITLNDEDGSPLDLTDYDAVDLVGDGLPEGVTSVIDAAAGRVQYSFTEPFEAPGVLLVRTRLSDGDNVDYTSQFEVEVRDVEPTAGLFVTTTQVEGLTATPVSTHDISLAQAEVEGILGIDLHSTAFVDALSTNDRRLLRAGISWQAAEHRKESQSVDAGIPPGATSVSNGDVTVSFGANGANAGAILAPLAMMSLRQLSWRRSKTVHARPYGDWRSSTAPYLWAPYGAPQVHIASDVPWTGVWS